MNARVLVSLALIALVGVAVAQKPLETSGTIHATLGGEERVWHTVITEGPGVRVNTADWSFFDMGSQFYAFGLAGYPGTAVTIDDVQTTEGRFELTFMFFGDLPADCPCTVEASIAYYTSDSITKNKYVNEEVPVTLTEFRPVDETTFAMAGDFAGTLAFEKDSLSDPNLEDTLDVSGSFEATLEPAGNQKRDKTD